MMGTFTVRPQRTAHFTSRSGLQHDAFTSRTTGVSGSRTRKKGRERGRAASDRRGRKLLTFERRVTPQNTIQWFCFEKVYLTLNIILAVMGRTKYYVLQATKVQFAGRPLVLKYFRLLLLYTFQQLVTNKQTLIPVIIKMPNIRTNINLVGP